MLFYFNSAYAWPFTSYNRAFARDNIDQHPELKRFLLVESETGQLAHRRNTYFQYGWGWTLSSGSLHDYPELHQPLGAPKGPYQRTNPEGWEFTREFEHASVWVNTASRQAKITWR